jgi:putative oxygen-independent coproporphyrinogen III oxidase
MTLPPPHPPAAFSGGPYPLPRGERGRRPRHSIPSPLVGEGGEDRRSEPGEGDEPFGIYVHWPFCLAKCPYCDFNSHVRHGGIDEKRFGAAYLAELRHFAGLAPGRIVTSIFFGGGTPSLMGPQTVSAILDEIAALWSVAPEAEVTLEANPTSVEADRFAGYRAAGVNRLSLGVQALDDVSLKALGRMHSSAEALDALAVAKRHFERVSFDLIYARQGQTVSEWREELQRALQHAADHLSLYQLTIEEGTPFAARHSAGTLRVPSSETAQELYVVTQELCEGAGLPAYEISNYARPGAECRHNLLYWRGYDYAGVGPGAHSRITRRGRKQAIVVRKSPEAWLEAVEAAGNGIEQAETLSESEAADEYLLMALRLSEGIDLNRLAKIDGRAFPETRVARLVEEGLIERNDRRLRATPMGRLVLDRLILELAA